MKRIVLAAILTATALPAASQTSSPMGLWLTEAKTAHVQLAPCSDTARGPLCGTIVKLLKDEDSLDGRNADPALRTRRIEGMVFLHDFKKGSEPNTFERGTIYNAKDGKNYSANVALQADGTLRLRGFAGLAMFGTTQIWTRVQ